MIGESSVLATTSGGDVAAAVATVHEGDGGGGSNSGEDEKNIRGLLDEGERMNYGANRWPRQETLALLKIRSDMDAIFRDATPKGPLWEEVSRKLAELGFHRSAKKCKEKFENVYKYHKRTKDGRTGKSEGKAYRFCDQLQALEHHHSSHSTPQLQPLPLPPPKPQTPAALPLANQPPCVISHPTVPSTTNNPTTTSMPQNIVTQATTNPIIATPISSSQPINHSQNFVPSFHNISTHLFSSSTSSSTASDEELEVSGRKRKRKWKEFFERLTKNVIKKQEELQRKFLETVEKHEYERLQREETWRTQEMARINREHEILIQERSIAAAKDAAVIAFLQKISGQQYSLQGIFPQSNQALAPPVPLPEQSRPPQLPPPQPPQQPISTVPAIMNLEVVKRDNGDNNNNNNNFGASSSSRWPKAEVQALINLRTNLDVKYQENGPKGPLWEEISNGMQRLGYNRSAKRCKEKWENINKYFKKVKESNKRRPEDSKTCPYFHQLDAIYKEKGKINNNEASLNSNNSPMIMPISTMEPLMVRPEQQWPLQGQQAGQPERVIMEDNERGVDMDQNFDEDEEDEGEEEDEDGDTEDDDGIGGFEIVANKLASMGANGE